MKTRNVMTVGMIVSVVVCLLSQYGDAKEIVRLTNGEWPPYFSQQLPHYGIGSRIVTEAFALEGIIVEYTFFPWKRALFLAKKGEYDGAVGWEINADREPYFYASDTVWEAPWVFFHRKSLSFDWTTFNDLAAYQLGGTLEYMYTPEFLEAEKAGKILVDRAAQDEFGWKKLVAGRIDLFPQLVDIGYYQINALFEPDTIQLITHHPTSFGIHAEQLLLSKTHGRNSQLLEIFNRGLQRLKASGTYDHYFEKLRESASQRTPRGRP